MRVTNYSNAIENAIIVVILAPVVFWTAPGLAADSKWTIENTFSGREVEAYVSRDSFAKNDDAFIQRLLAEGCLKEGDARRAANLIESSIKALGKSTKSNDLRLQSARIALAEAYLKNGQRQKSLDLIKIVLKQQFESDEKEEARYRKLLSANDLLEKDVESQTQFELRYQDYYKSVKVAPIAVLARQAQRLYWDNRLLDSQSMSNIGLQLSDTGNKVNASSTTDDTAGDASRKNLVFLQALIFFAMDDRLQLSESVTTLTNLVGANSKDNPDAGAHWHSRLTFLNGLIARLDGKNSEAEKLYGTAIDAVRKSEDKYDVLLFRVYLGNSLMASGDPVAAYEELNHAFEDSRRLIEGRKKGLEYIGIAKASLDSMYKCLIIRMSYVEEPDVVRSVRSVPSTHSTNSPGSDWERRHPGGISKSAGSLRSQESIDLPSGDPLAGVASVCDLNPLSSALPVFMSANIHPYKEDYQRLADALYHVGYQNKVTKNQSRARQLFWYSARIYEKHVPENRRQLAGVLYDLAESFSWSDSKDLAVAIFETCAEIRKQIDPNSNDYIMTLNTLGRNYMANREAKKATDTLRTVLSLSLRREERQRDRVSRLIAQLKSRDKFDSVSTPVNTTSIDALPLESQLNAVTTTRAKADSDVRAQLEDLWQVLADSYSSDKRYDEAKQVSLGLLKLRKDSKTASKDELLDSIWQFAYICGVSNSLEDAKKYYGEMIEKHAKGPGKPLADWYYNRAVVEDSLGQPAAASRDFRRAIAEYKTHLKTLDKIDDAETIQHIGWLIGDLQLELKAKSMCPPNSPNYFHSYPHFHWGADRFPLKIYIDNTEARGFGPKLYTYMKKAVDEWSDTPGMKDRFVFVDDREKADIYFERMSSYDLIPFGSGGGATASFVNRGQKSTKEIDRVHLRLYCREYDLDRLSRHAVEQLYTLALHEFGHGLGLGHSPGGGDIMYWKSAMNSISSRDRATLLKIYSFQEGKPD